MNVRVQGDGAQDMASVEILRGAIARELFLWLVFASLVSITVLLQHYALFSLQIALPLLAFRFESICTRTGCLLAAKGSCSQQQAPSILDK